MHRRALQPHHADLLAPDRCARTRGRPARRGVRTHSAAGLPGVSAHYFQLEPTAHWDFLTAAQGIGIAILASLLFTLPPLIGIRHIRPSLILRREMEETRPGWRTRLAEARASLFAGAVILIGFAGIAMSFATGTPRDIWRTGEYFAERWRSVLPRCLPSHG